MKTMKMTHKTRYNCTADILQWFINEHNQVQSKDELEKVALKVITAIDNECEIKYIKDVDGLIQKVTGELQLKRSILADLKAVATPLLTLNEYTSFEKVVGKAGSRKKQLFPSIFSLIKEDSLSASIVKESAIKRLNERLTNYVLIDAQALIDNAINELKSDSWYRRLLALILLTGRRPYEVAVTATYKQVDEHSVIFSGQAKEKKGYREVRDNYQIPVLTNPATIIESLAWMREKNNLKKMSGEQFNKRCSKTYNDYFIRYWKRLFPTNIDDLSPYALRRAYAAIAYSKWGNNQIEVNYTANILGHSVDDKQTALHYVQFKA